MSETPRPPQPRTNWKVSRQFRRFKLDQRVSVKLMREGVETTLRGRSSDISEGGLGATLAGELEPGAEVSLSFWLPLSREPVEVRARVQYRMGFRYGFAFLTLNGEQRARIEKLSRSMPAAE
jgi:c-di-GMP-binding flagellar brake protein YcgR